MNAAGGDFQQRQTFAGDTPLLHDRCRPVTSRGGGGRYSRQGENALSSHPRHHSGSGAPGQGEHLLQGNRITLNIFTREYHCIDAPGFQVLPNPSGGRLKGRIGDNQSPFT